MLMKTLIVFLFLPTLLFAQDCEYLKNEIDKFTKTKTVLTKGAKIERRGKYFTLIKGLVLNEYKYLRVTMTTYRISSFRRDSKFMLMSESDSVITLNAVDHSKSDHSFVWYATINYEITEEQLAYLISNKITTVRFYGSDGYIEKEIKDKYAVLFQNDLKCIQD